MCASVWCFAQTDHFVRVVSGLNSGQPGISVLMLIIAETASPLTTRTVVLAQHLGNSAP